MRGGVSGEPFSAVSRCPACSYIGIHYLDEPIIASDDELALYDIALEEWEDSPDKGDPVYAWGEAEPVRYMGGKPKPKPPVDESEFEVMRICVVCGHRWGNV